MHVREPVSEPGTCAGPGVIVGTVLTAALVKYTFPYNWSWVESLLFGAMFSATDPVAVVAVLKEVSKRSQTDAALLIWTVALWRHKACAGRS